MSLFESDYNSGGASDNNNSNDGDFEERESLKLSNYGIISFEIDRLGEYTGSAYGQSLIVDINDVQVIDGMVYDRFYSDDDDTIKVFGYDKWFRTDENGSLAEEVTDDLVNKRITEEFGGDQYPYEFEERTTEAEGNIELGHMTMWLGNGTKNRTFAKVVTPQGHDIVNDKDDDYNWLATEDPTIRDDLEGRRVILLYKKESFVPDDAEDGEEVTYTDAAIFDEDTRAPITIQNGSSGGSSGGSSSDDGGDSGSLGGGDGGNSTEGVPAEADSIIDFMARTGETAPDEVEQLLTTDIDDDVEYDLDAVIEEVKSRM